MGKAQAIASGDTIAGHLAWQSQDGHSRLYQGDCFDVMASLPSGSMDCIWTDPPYLLSNDGMTCVSGRMVPVNKGDWDRSNGVGADHDFNRAWLAECHRLLKPAGTIWVSGTLHVYLSVGLAMMQLGFRILNDIIWEKPAPPPNLGCRCFTHSTETILWATKARKGKEFYTFNYEAMKEENAGKQMKNVWRMSPPDREEKRFGKHPTQKPVALIARSLRASTNPGDAILDPFSGSSTTGVAALLLGRRYLGIERQAEYVDVATRRLTRAESASTRDGCAAAPSAAHAAYVPASRRAPVAQPARGALRTAKRQPHAAALIQSIALFPDSAADA